MLTLDELRDVMVECSGESDALHLAGDISDRDFNDLGYDSLARMETAAVLKRRYGVEIPEAELSELTTPRALLEFVNGPAARG